MMWFHLECFLFFQSTCQKTVTRSVSQPGCSLCRVMSRVTVSDWGGSFSTALIWSPRDLGVQELVAVLYHGWAANATAVGTVSGEEVLGSGWTLLWLSAFTQLQAESWCGAVKRKFQSSAV